MIIITIIKINFGYLPVDINESKEGRWKNILAGTALKEKNGKRK